MKNCIYNRYFNIFTIAILAISLTICQPIGANILFVLKNNNEQRITTETNIYDLLIIAPEEYTSLLKPLVAHKNNVGVITNLVSLSEVYAQSTLGRDNPEKIKIYIKKAYENWDIKYVMLVGNFRKMPVRYVYNDEPWQGYPEPYFISDLYYADIIDSYGNYSSWDTNNNGIYGEWKGEVAQDQPIDLRPDVYVGRLACRNKIEVKILVKKIMTYETTTYDKYWFKKIVGVGGDTYPDGQYDFPTPEYEGEENLRLMFENMTGFEHIELFTSTGNFTGPLDIIRAFNKGAGFFAFDGHANPKTWSTHPPNDKKNWTNGLNLFTISFLMNRDKYPIVVAGACHNNEFDVNLLNWLEDSHDAYYYGIGALECWGWKLTRKIGGGAIACIANTGLGMSKEDKSTRNGAGDYMDLQFFYEYGTNKTDILGECWGKAINRYLDAFPIDWNSPSAWDYAYDCKTVQQWLLLGDPSLKIGGYSLGL